MYSHISAIPILAIMNYNHCSGSDVYLTSNGLQTLFFRMGFFSGGLLPRAQF